MNYNTATAKLEELFPSFSPNQGKEQQEKEWVKCMLFFLEFQKIVNRRKWRYPNKAFCESETRKEFLARIDGLKMVMDEQVLLNACDGYENDFQALYDYFTQMGAKEFFALPAFEKNKIVQKFVDKALQDKLSNIEIFWMIFLASDSCGEDEDVYQKYCKYCGDALDLESFLARFGQLRSLCVFPTRKLNASSQANSGIVALRNAGANDEYIEEKYIDYRKFVMKDDWHTAKRKTDVKHPARYIKAALGLNPKIEAGIDKEVDSAVKHFAMVKEPAKFLETLRFPGGKSDTGLECGFALREVEKIIDARFDEKDHFLLIDPTPAFLDELLRERPQVAERVTVATRNDLEMEILSHGYPQFCFCNFEDVTNEDRQYAGIAVFARNDAPSVLEWVFSESVATDHTAIMALLPLKTINENLQLRQAIMKTYPWVEVFLLPPGSSTTAPKKKVIICGERKEREGVKIVGLEWIVCGGEKYLTNSPGRLAGVRAERFKAYSGRTIHDLFGQIIRNKQQKAPSGKRQSALKLQFSKELTICYRIEDDTGGTKVVAYICDFPTIKQIKRHSNGKARMETKTTKRMKDPSKASIWLLDTMPYRDNVQKVFAEIFHKARNEKTGQVTDCPWLNDFITLKTIWYLSSENIGDLRKEGLNPRLENQKRLMDSPVGKLDTGTDLAAIQSAMEQFFEQNSFKAEEKDLYWKNLNQIFMQAKEKDYCENNPVAEFLRQRKDPAMGNIRQALTKKSFTREEMTKIWQLLETEGDGEGKALSTQIRLMTGLELNVVAGLQWGDLCALDLPENDQACQSIYQLRISRQVLNNATACKGFAEKEDYRRIPLVSALAKKLLMRKERIMEKFGVKDSAIKELFICYTDEEIEKSLSSGSKGEKVYPSPRKLQGYARKVVAKLGIEEDVLVLPDVNKGRKETNLANYGGDIFKANFRFYCRQVCGMRQEDEDYLMGVQQKNTHGKHYCDFSNDYIQLVLFYELERWASVLQEDTKADIKDCQFSLQDGKLHWVSDLISGERANAMITIEAKEPSGLTVISCQAKCGFDGKVIIADDEVKR